MLKQCISPEGTTAENSIGPKIRQSIKINAYSVTEQSIASRSSEYSEKTISAQKSKSSFPNSNQVISVDLGDFSLTHGPELTDKNLKVSITRTEKKSIRQSGPTQLQQIVKDQKIKRLVRNFIKKATQNNKFLDPIEYTPFYNPTQLKFWDYEGIQINDHIFILMAVLGTFLIVILTIIYTLSIVFTEIDQSILLKVLQPISLIFYLAECGLNLISVKIQEGKRIVTFKEIFLYCARNNSLLIDVLSIAIIVADFFVDDQSFNYVRLFLIIKLRTVLEKLERLEIFFIHNFYSEQYWSLLKVFIFNFSLAHFLAIVLIGMSYMNPNENWMNANSKTINLAPWPEKYAWSYYWATTIMLTVGFGDFTATNYEEAIVLTMIEMISCITLAYNINCVGTLMTNIRQQDLQKGKNFRIFYKLSKKNGISDDLEWRINNYIEESSNIKKKFNYKEENIFIENLPIGLKSQFLKESHKKIFYDLPFFKHLKQRTLFNFAQKIQMHICHPEEIIQSIDEPENLLILKKGEIGFTCKKNGCDFNNTVVDFIKIYDSEPVLLSLGFISKPRLIYEIKSMEYSILFYMDYENVLSILKENESDYEIYCYNRDKSSIHLDEFELFTCQICKGRHTKFTCPKLHYIPFRQQVALRHIHKMQVGKEKREILFRRFNAKQYCAIKIYKDQTWLEQRLPSISDFRHSTEMQNSPFMHVSSKRAQIGKAQSFEEEDVLIREITGMKDFFAKNTAEIIKHEVSKALHENQADDLVWLIEVDRIRNYKTYFEAQNGSNIKNRVNLMKKSETVVNPLQKLAKLQEKMNFYSNQNNGHTCDISERFFKFNPNSKNSIDNVTMKTSTKSSKKYLGEGGTNELKVSESRMQW